MNPMRIPSRTTDQEPLSRAMGGYTLIELLLIVVIMGIVATSAIPVLSQSVQARQGASRDEAVRLFEYARGRAIAGGIPSGIVVDPSSSTLRLVTLDENGTIINILDPIDADIKQSDLSNEYAGVSINSFVNGDDSSGSGTVWFDFRAEPHTRNETTGVFEAVFSQNATLTLSTGTLIVVHFNTGFIEDR